jgi:hypothetical protein
LLERKTFGGYFTPYKEPTADGTGFTSVSEWQYRFNLLFMKIQHVLCRQIRQLGSSNTKKKIGSCLMYRLLTKPYILFKISVLYLKMN